MNDSKSKQLLLFWTTIRTDLTLSLSRFLSLCYLCSTSFLFIFSVTAFTSTFTSDREPTSAEPSRTKPSRKCHNKITKQQAEEVENDLKQIYVAWNQLTTVSCGSWQHSASKYILLSDKMRRRSFRWSVCRSQSVCEAMRHECFMR